MWGFFLFCFFYFFNRKISCRKEGSRTNSKHCPYQNFWCGSCNSVKAIY